MSFFDDYPNPDKKVKLEHLEGIKQEIKLESPEIPQRIPQKYALLNIFDALNSVIKEKEQIFRHLEFQYILTLQTLNLSIYASQSSLNSHLIPSLQLSGMPIRLTDKDLIKKNIRVKKVKSPQSKFKNIYGLVAGRVIKSCKNYFKLYPEYPCFIEDHSRYHYVHKHLSLLDQEEKQKFEKFISKYNSENKGTTRDRGKLTLQNFLAKNRRFGLIVTDLIQEFLFKDNPDLRDYISDGKRLKKTDKVLSNEMDLKKLRNIFREMQDEIKNPKYLSIKKEETKSE